MAQASHIPAGQIPDADPLPADREGQYWLYCRDARRP
jgi:rhodanese-related sulfurtransferase